MSRGVVAEGWGFYREIVDGVYMMGMKSLFKVLLFGYGVELIMQVQLAFCCKVINRFRFVSEITK